MIRCEGCNDLGFYSSPRDCHGHVRPGGPIRVPCPEPACRAGLRLRAELAEVRACEAPGDCGPCCGTGYTAAAWAFSDRFRGPGRGDCSTCEGTGFTELEAALAWEERTSHLLTVAGPLR